MKKLLTSLCFSVLVLTAAPVLMTAAEPAKAPAKNVRMLWITASNDIYVQARPEQCEVTAANELRRVMRQWRPNDDPAQLIFSDKPVGGYQKNILIGTMDSPLIKPYADKLQLKKSDCDQIAYGMFDGKLVIAGNSPRAVIFSVSHFLQKYMGMRYLWPGESGTFCSRDVIQIPEDLNYNFTSPFRYRTMSKTKNNEGATWFNVHNFIQDGGFDFGGERLGGGEAISPRRSDYKDHPDWFALRNGVRYLPPPEGWSWVINGCWSNEGFTKDCIDRLIQDIPKFQINHLSTHPADDGGRCECENCKALIQPDESTRWFKYHAKIVREIKKVFPDIHYSVLAYQEYREVPAEKVEEVEFVEYCNYTRCFVHKISNQDCPSNRADFRRFQEWIDSGKAPAMGLWDYTYDVFNPYYSMPMYSYFADLIKWCAKHGIVKIYFENEVPASISRPATWVAQQMLWDPSQDEEKLLDDYCAAAYGPAAKIMANYHRACAAAWEAMPTHLSQCFNPPGGTAKLYLTPELQKLAAETFEKADAAFKLDRAQLELAKKDPKTNPETIRMMESKLKQKLDAIAFEKKQYEKWLTLYEKMQKQSFALTIYKGTGANDFKQSAVPVKGMFLYDGKKKEDIETSVYWTDHSFVVKVTSMDGTPAPKFKKQHDKDVTFSTGSIELFLQPQGCSSYYHFDAERSGSYYEGEGYDGKWDCEWDFSVNELDGGWSVTIVIPFESLKAKPKDGDVWKMIIDCNIDQTLKAGLPKPLFHDMGAAADITFSEGRRP